MLLYIYIYIEVLCTVVYIYIHTCISVVQSTLFHTRKKMCHRRTGDAKRRTVRGKFPPWRLCRIDTKYIFYVQRCDGEAEDIDGATWQGATEIVPLRCMRCINPRTTHSILL